MKKLKRNIRIFLSKKITGGVSFFLLFFSVPVFAFQHSVCYINECPVLIESISVSDHSDDVKPCHGQQEEQDERECASGDSECDIGSAAPVPDSEKDFRSHVSVKIQSADPAFTPYKIFFERISAREPLRVLHRKTQPVYILTAKLLI